MLLDNETTWRKKGGHIEMFKNQLVESFSSSK